MDGRTVILAIKQNVNDLLFLPGHLLAMLVSASLLLALSFLLVRQQQHLSILQVLAKSNCHSSS
jgi:ABC-type polysaccharide/polyol phosphate export permease